MLASGEGSEEVKARTRKPPLAAVVAVALAAVWALSACTSSPSGNRPTTDAASTAIAAEPAPASGEALLDLTGSETVEPGSITPARRGEMPSAAISGTDLSSGETVEGHLPPATPAVVAWSDWCFFDAPNTPYTGAFQCSASMSSFSWALTHLEADEACVLDQYTKLIKALAEIRGSDPDGAKTNAAEDLYGWHNCATVIDPDPDDGRSLAAKCESLPEVRKTRTALYGSCAEWAEAEMAISGSTPNCSASTALLFAWMKSHHGDDALRGARFDC